MDNMAKVREAQKSLDMMIGPESDIQNIREALALLAEDKPSVPMAMLYELAHHGVNRMIPIFEKHGYAVKE